MKKLQYTLLLPIFLFSGTLIGQNIQMHTYWSTVNHDPTTCSVHVFAEGMVTIQNSFLNDEVKFLDHNENIIVSETNTTGASPWSPNYNPQGSTIQSDYYAVMGNNVFVHILPPIYKIIRGVDTLYNPTLQVLESLSFTPCTYGSVSGTIYIDNNSDCSNNAGDIGVTYINPSVNGNYSSNPHQNYFYTGNTNGNYQVNLQEDHLQNYTVSIPPIYAFTFPPSPCFQSSYTFNNLPQANVDFPLQCADFDTYVTYSSTPARPGIPFNLSPRVFNIGCDLVSGVLKLKLDPNVTYNAALSTHPADAQVGDTLIWYYSNLNNLANNTAYFNQFLGGIHLTPSLAVSIGDSLLFHLSTAVLPNDVDASNNVRQIKIPIVNSYDPNVKNVEPKGRDAEGYIPVDTETLTYTIHFQNTGTADAINVYVLDTLEANLDPKSLQILATSHQMTPSWINDSVVKFNFPNIHLADSLSNEPESHGFVKFKINLKPNLPVGTVIKNKVGIYFDFNAPIITNYAINTLENPLSISEYANFSGLSVYPNPTKEKVTFEFKDAYNGSLELLDLSGKQVVHKQVMQKTTIDVQSLQSGVYFYRIDNHENGASIFGKIIVQ